MSSLNYEPIEVAIALGLYAYNVSANLRANKIYTHFDGACAEPEELLAAVMTPQVATELPFPSAEVYVKHALEAYGAEAKRIVLLNRKFYEG